MRKFVLDLYACDTVPLRHLQSKLAYLYKLPPEVINIFIQNYNPQEVVRGKPPFRKAQCEYIVEIKNRIRNLYNPKHNNPDFQILPLDKGVSHEHVIHASDYEDQVDYYLKLLGCKNGVTHLENDNEGLLFEKPYYIPRPRQYSFRQIPVSLLLANILSIENGHPVKILTMVNDTPHYKALCYDMDTYKRYLYQFRFKYLCDDYSVEKILSLKTLGLEQLKALPPILVKPMDGNYCILDGVHRSAVSLFHGFDKINCVVFEQ